MFYLLILLLLSLVLFHKQSFHRSSSSIINNNNINKSDNSRVLSSSSSSSSSYVVVHLFVLQHHTTSSSLRKGQQRRQKQYQINHNKIQQLILYPDINRFLTLSTTTKYGMKMDNSNNADESQSTTSISQRSADKFNFSIDRGGTFTDIYCQLPYGKGDAVMKLLSVDPNNYNDAPTEGIRRILHKYDTTNNNDGSTKSNNKYERGNVIPTNHIGSIRMGTTVATNALLERKGTKTAFITTIGYNDILEIGNQNRPNIFDLTCKKPSLLYHCTIAINERITLTKFYENDPIDIKTNQPYRIETGITGETVYIIQTPNEEIVKEQLIQLRDIGIKAIAICFMHSYIYPEHEKMIGRIAKELNCFEQITLSYEIIPMIKLISRSHTTIAAAYLTPEITYYISNFMKGFDEQLLYNTSIQFMKSDGGLTTSIYDFHGHQAILSGPAGGVVGYAKTTQWSTRNHQLSSSSSTTTIVKNNNKQQLPVVGFDMGGTSTDVSRYDGKSMEHVMETVTAGISIQAPQLDIHTVAAGGGSRLYLKRGMFIVGPESVGAHPGPISYRKNGQYLSVTDANVVLGRIIPKYFPSIFGINENESLDIIRPIEEFTKLTKLPEAIGRTVEELAYGFLNVANEAMCRPMRNLTQMKGYDITQHILACFGGAGPQHACSIAKKLGISKVFIHKYGGILSAYGLSMADAVHEEQCPASEIYNPNIGLSSVGIERLNTLIHKATEILRKQGYNKDNIIIERYVNMRYDGTDNAMMILDNDDARLDETFRSHYIREFGFTLEGRNILIDDYRIRAIVPGNNPSDNEKQTARVDGIEQQQPIQETPSSILPPVIKDTTRAYFESGWKIVPVYMIEDLQSGHEILGPCIIVQPISTVVVEEHCSVYMTNDGNLEITIETSTTISSDVVKDEIESSTISDTNDDNTSGKHQNDDDTSTNTIQEDPVQLSIFAHRFMGIAEQMGRTLQRTAISVNMKERLDFSCALFTKDGGLVANAPHIPVHLGAMERAVRFQIEYWNSDDHEGIQDGDVLVSNHPQLAGGSHLPDITVITPVFYKGKIIFFVASRGHHADIGGIAPGSMPPHSHTLEDEGAMIIAYKLVKDGKFQEEGITNVLKSPGLLPGNSGTRNLQDNLSDLRAQVAANNAGIRLLNEMIQEYGGIKMVEAYMVFIQKNAEIAVRRMLQDFVVKQNGLTTAHAIDYMDDGSKIELTITIEPNTGSAIFDFTGTDPQVLGNHNAPPAVTYSAVIYSLRSLVAEDIPLNQGCLAPITFIIPKYTLLNPSSDAAVVGGNVLTSQRIVDVVLLAFQACAASQGCMNNLTFGDKQFGYYETIAGGAGAGPTWDGQSGIHTHCTNTRITDPEILEKRYPVLLHQFSIRKGSGGRGLHPGGDGVIRELEFLRPLTMSILSERRTLHPYGMAGGMDGECGRNLIIRKDGIVVNIGGRCSTILIVGEHLRIETPGGGGYGALPSPGPLDPPEH